MMTSVACRQAIPLEVFNQVGPPKKLISAAANSYLFLQTRLFAAVNTRIHENVCEHFMPCDFEYVWM